MNDSAKQQTQPDPDAPLVAGARQGDFAAFEQLVGRHEAGLYNLSMRILHRPEDAEDVVQQAFLSAMQGLQNFAGASQFRTWLVRIATNHALKTLRKRRGLPVVSMPADEDDFTALPHPEFIAPWQQEPWQLAHDRETQQLIARALDRLDEKYRLVFLLRDVEGLSVEETAETLGLTSTNVKVRLLRARLMLRERLTRVLGDPAQQITGHKHED